MGPVRRNALIAAGFAAAAALALAAFILIPERSLAPSVSCTKMACMPQQPCCNSCIHDGWQTGGPVYAQAVALRGQLPTYPADGCGQIQSALLARGVRRGWHFYVISYREVFHGPGPDPPGPDPP